MASKERPSGAPGTDDTLSSRGPTDARDQGQLDARISRYLRTLYAAGDDADERHARALDELRREPAEAVIALARAEASSKPRDYPRRWALVYATTRLDHDAALPYLRALVLNPLPAVDMPDPHARTVSREETILRTTAIEGIGRLAQRGNKGALDALLEFLDIPSISIRRASIQTLLSVEPGYRERIAERLPADFRYLLDVRATPVTNVPQVKDPRKHLREAKPTDKPLPPQLAPNSSPRQPKARAPKVRKR
jgi:hypothetical protein